MPKRAAVLYTYDLQPITVVGLSNFLWDMLHRGDMVQLVVPEPFKFEAPDPTQQMRLVRIRAEHFRFRGHDSMMLFTEDEEYALALQAAFLPGQHGEVQRRERRAFINGFLTALDAL
ncbi:hypothetical protein [Piscinibacter gummiphilus]|uniref:Uncharacterized protein n=1 Tax=Piscinibacter gummiphilus TaxID=946333 RepID=A0ABZ0CNQ5_9BURK|nr:hypothetical protein [Piscinibacter gummiphilus]WOB06519.1 hypothetical protein RXV79_16475 [Piscinibacter gummiphilus]